MNAPRAVQGCQGLQFPDDLDAHEPEEGALRSKKGEPANRTSGQANLTEELIDEVADLHTKVARLTARVRKLE